MATLLHSPISNFHARTEPTAWRGLGVLVRRTVAALAEAHERRRELRQLLEMDERALKDIGLTRVDAIRFAHESPRHVVRPAAAPAAPPRITAQVLDHHKHRAQQLRTQTVRHVAHRIAAGVRHAIVGRKPGRAS